MIGYGYSCCGYYNIRYWHSDGKIGWSRAWDKSCIEGSFPTYVGRLSNADIVVCGQPTTDDGYTLKRYDQDGGLMWAVDCRLGTSGLTDHYPDCLAVRDDDRIVLLVNGVTGIGDRYFYGVEVSAADGTVLRYTTPGTGPTLPLGRLYWSKSPDGIPYFIHRNGVPPVADPRQMCFRWLALDSEFSAAYDGTQTMPVNGDFVISGSDVLMCGEYILSTPDYARLGSIPFASNTPNWTSNLWGSTPTPAAANLGTMDITPDGTSVILGINATHPTTGDAIGCSVFSTLIAPSSVSDSSHFVKSLEFAPWFGPQATPDFLRIVPLSGNRFVSYGLTWKPSMFNYSTELPEWRHLHGAYEILAPDASGNTVGCGRGNWLRKDDQSFLSLT